MTRCLIVCVCVVLSLPTSDCLCVHVLLCAVQLLLVESAHFPFLGNSVWNDKVSSKLCVENG